MKSPKLILCSDWLSLGKEIRKQLKPYGLTLKFKSKKEWCDAIAVKINKIGEKHQIIHKSISPKKDYCNPTLCIADLSSEDAHKLSNTKWDKVTCKKCLTIRKFGCYSLP